MAVRHGHITLPAQSESVTAGRHFLTLTLAEWGLGALTDEVALAASELLTNAVLHARTPLEVAMQLTDQLVVSVQDGCPPWQADLSPPDLTEPGQDDVAAWDSEGGRGLLLLAAVSDAWGIRPEPTGKTVWFSLALPAAFVGR